MGGDPRVRRRARLEARPQPHDRPRRLPTRGRGSRQGENRIHAVSRECGEGAAQGGGRRRRGRRRRAGATGTGGAAEAAAAAAAVAASDAARAPPTALVAAAAVMAARVRAVARRRWGWPASIQGLQTERRRARVGATRVRVFVDVCDTRVQRREGRARGSAPRLKKRRNVERERCPQKTRAPTHTRAQSFSNPTHPPPHHNHEPVHGGQI